MLIGRDAELAVLTATMARFQDDLSTVLVLRGESGVGKTALVDHAVRSAGHCRLVRFTGVESERELSHAALHRLLRPFLPGIENLPQPQYLSLARAFGLVDGPAPGLFLVGLATLTLLAESAKETPLLCVIDDAQWMDRASIGVLTFVARRLLADRIGMFFCVRDQAPDDSPFDGLPELRLGALNESDSRALLERSAGKSDPHVARRIVDAAQGNPLAIIEFARQLTPVQLSGEQPTAEQLPVSRRIEAHYVRQVRSLPQAAQTLLLLAAAEPSGDPDLLWRAAGVLGLGEDDRAATEHTVDDFLTFQPDVTFRHPLIRSAVYGGSPAGMLREVHSALAQVIDERTDPDRRSWHLAAATYGQDEGVAMHLERSAARARVRGGYAAESAFLVKAAELSSDDTRRGVRLVAAAAAAMNAGDYRRCQALLTQTEPLLNLPELRAQAARVHGYNLSPLGRQDEAPAALVSSAQTLGQFDRAAARQTWSAALSAGWLTVGRAKGTTLAEVASAVLAARPTLSNGRETDEDILRNAIATRIAVGYPEAAPALRDAILRLNDTVESGVEFMVQPILVFVASCDLWDPGSGRALLRYAAARERERGGLMALWQCLETLGYLERWSGRLEAGRACEQEAAAIADAIGLGRSWKFPRAEMSALRGRDTEMWHAITEFAKVFDSGGGLGASLMTDHLLKAVHALSRGRYDDAFRDALVVHEQDAPVYGNQILPELIEAAVQVGSVDVAREALHRLEIRALASGTDWARGLLCRSQALLAPREQAEPRFRSAVEHLRRARVPLDHARAHLLYGEWLRKEGRLTDATGQLDLAHTMFTDMGTGAFADRARSELAEAGGHADLPVARDRVLTPQEEQIVRLAARGLTNREIATTLFVSESTVAYHLKKVFRKLNVTSRRELPREAEVAELEQ